MDVSRLNGRRSKCALTFNGVNLDSKFKNYMTVNVEGRQILAPILNTVSVPGRPGDVVIGQNLPPRKITVHYLLSAKDNREWLKYIKMLNEHLYSETDVEFSFDDESGVRYGRLESVNNPSYDSNFGMGSFTIHCQDPFLYGESKEAVNKVEYYSLGINKYPVKWDMIIINVNSSRNKVEIYNPKNRKSIILNGSFSYGDLIVISNADITVNGQSRLAWLDYVRSDYHELDIYNGDSLRSKHGEDVKISYRERVL